MELIGEIAGYTMVAAIVIVMICCTFLPFLNQRDGDEIQ